MLFDGGPALIVLKARLIKVNICPWAVNLILFLHHESPAFHHHTSHDQQHGTASVASGLLAYQLIRKGFFGIEERSGRAFQKHNNGYARFCHAIFY